MTILFAAADVSGQLHQPRARPAAGYHPCVWCRAGDAQPITVRQLLQLSPLRRTSGTRRGAERGRQQTQYQADQAEGLAACQLAEICTERGKERTQRTIGLERTGQLRTHQRWGSIRESPPGCFDAWLGSPYRPVQGDVGAGP